MHPEGQKIFASEKNWASKKNERILRRSLELMRVCTSFAPKISRDEIRASKERKNSKKIAGTHASLHLVRPKNLKR